MDGERKDRRGRRSPKGMGRRIIEERTEREAEGCLETDSPGGRGAEEIHLSAKFIQESAKGKEKETLATTVVRNASAIPRRQAITPDDNLGDRRFRRIRKPAPLPHPPPSHPTPRSHSQSPRRTDWPRDGRRMDQNTTDERTN